MTKKGEKERKQKNPKTSQNYTNPEKGEKQWGKIAQHKREIQNQCLSEKNKQT